MAELMRVKTMMPPGHIRTPSYLRGKTGIVERRLGAFGNPEEQAYGRIGDRRELLRIRFRMGDIWGAEAENSGAAIFTQMFGRVCGFRLAWPRS